MQEIKKVRFEKMMVDVNVKKTSSASNYVYFNNSLNIISNMSELSIEILKQIVEKLPDDFIVEFKNREGSTVTVSDDINVKISEKRLVLRTY